MIRFLTRIAWLGVIAACASSGASTSQPVAVPEVFARSDVMSALEAMRDSASLRGGATFTVVVEPDSAPRLKLLRSSFEEAAAVSLGTRLASLPANLPGEPQRFLMDVMFGDSVGYLVRPWQQRRPEHLNREELVRRLTQLAGQVPDGTSATLWLYVEPTGAVSKTRVSVGSGNANWDQQLQAIAMTGVFTPCSIDGEPMACWIELPFMVPRRGR